MRRLRLIGASAFVSFAVVVGTAQQQTHDAAAQVTQLRPTHPPEPVTPVPPGAYAGEPTIPINSATWTPLGPAPILNGQRPGGGPVSGRLTGIAAHPSDPNTIYVTAAGGGIWKTTNGTWTPLADAAVQSMGAIAIAPSNPNVVYAGTGEANNSGDSNFGWGILISTDGFRGHFPRRP